MLVKSKRYLVFSSIKSLLKVRTSVLRAPPQQLMIVRGLDSNPFLSALECIRLRLYPHISFSILN